MPDPEKAPKFEDTEEVKSPNAPSFDDTEPIDGLKKKEPTSAPLNSASVGGSSASETGASASPKFDYSVLKDIDLSKAYRAPTKTALGNKAFNYTAPNKNITLEEEANNKKLAKDTETKMIVDKFNDYKTAVPPNEKPSVAGFYLKNLKDTNPDEYNYVIDKQKALSEEGDPLKIQEYHAELIKKSLGLKKRVLNGKLDIVSNNINDNYKPILEDFDNVSKESEGLATKIQGIDNFIKENFQVDQNGQVITDPTNRKVAEDMFNQRTTLLNQLQTNKSKLDEYSNNQDLKDAMTQLDDIQKDYDSVEEQYKDFVTKNPNAYNGLPEVKKQIEKEQQAQFSKDINEPLDGDLGIMEGAGRGATGIVKALAYGVKNLGEDKGYGFTDTFYDDVKGSLDKFDAESNPLPTGYDKPVYEDGKWNLQYLPGKLAQTTVEMAPMALATSGVGLTAGLIARGAATQELGYVLGSFAGEHVMAASNYYDEAKEAGMSEDDAQDFANKTATAQAMISMLSPDIRLMKGTHFGLDDFTKMVAKGVSKKEAAKQVAKTIVNNMLKEIPQENLQTWKEIQDQNAMYEQMGLNDKIKTSLTNDFVETTVISALLTAGFGLGGAKSASTLQKQAAYMAASQPQQILERGKKMLDQGQISPQDFDNLALQLVKSEEALRKVDVNLPAETKAEVLPAMIEKNDLKEEKANVDDSQHDIINEKIKNKDEEIKNIMEAPSKEQIEHDDFLKGFDHAVSAEDKPKFEIPKSENEMQLEGLIEKDDSQKSEPIELSPKVETEIPESKTNDDQIAILEKARKDLKVNEFFQEKIDYKEFSKRDAALEKEINALKKPVAIEEEKIADTVEQDKGEPVAKKKQSEKTEPATQSPVETKVEKGPSTETKDKKAPDNESLIDEEDSAEEQIKDDHVVVQKMLDDLEVLKQYSPSNAKMDSKSGDEIKLLATKKYQGMIERAYKAKLDGKINRSTYTLFRNSAGDILGPKIAEKNREVKGQIDAIKEKIKEKLLGEGYKSGQLMAMSAPILNPKTVADFIDLTAELVKRGVDAGHEVRKVVDKALDYVKSHKNYADALKGEKVSDKKFRKLFESKISEIESIVEEPVNDEVKTTNETKPVEEKKTVESNNENVDNTEKKPSSEEKKPVQSNEKPVISEEDIQTGEKKKRKGTERLEANKEYENIVKAMSEEDKNYSVFELDKLYDSVNKKISEFEKAGLLDELANNLLDKEKSKNIPTNAMPELLSQLGDKFNVLAEQEQNEFVKQQLYDKAAALFADKGKIMTTAAQTMNAGRLSAERMPTSEAGVKAFVKEKMDQVQDNAMTETNKKDLEIANKELVDLQVKKELEKIAAGTMSKERIEKVKGISSLKIDLSDC